ncbi:MAG: hypothetical protein V7L26_04755 [Nostoc sp.]|uniref:hypothetical protein n=1 Tax=Nostoc sp. TaxID=1180 RepID=UPI002FF0C199
MSETEKQNKPRTVTTAIKSHLPHLSPTATTVPNIPQCAQPTHLARKAGKPSPNTSPPSSGLPPNPTVKTNSPKNQSQKIQNSKLEIQKNRK